MPTTTTSKLYPKPYEFLRTRRDGIGISNVYIMYEALRYKFSSFKQSQKNALCALRESERVLVDYINEKDPRVTKRQLHQSEDYIWSYGKYKKVGDEQE